LVADEPDEPFEYLKGTVAVSGNWEEWDRDHRAFWKFSISINLSPLVSGKVEAPLKFVPPGISFLGDFYLFADFTAEIDVSVEWGQLTPDHLDAEGSVEGKVEVAVGARLSMMHDAVLKVEVSIESGFSFEVTTQHEGLHIWLEAELKWEGAVGSFNAEGLWGIVSYDRQVTLWEEYSFGTWEWDPIEKIADWLES
jgi:hypothetical protein